MARKSYRSYGQTGDVGPFAATVAALCIGIAFAAPWLLLAAGFFALLRWVAA